METTIKFNTDGTFVELDTDGTEIGFGDWRDMEFTDALIPDLQSQTDAYVEDTKRTYADALAAYPEDNTYFGTKLAYVFAEIARRGASYNPYRTEYAIGDNPLW